MWKPQAGTLSVSTMPFGDLLMRNPRTPFRLNVAFKALSASLSACFMLAGCDKEAPPPAAMPAPQVAVVAVQPRAVTLTTELPGRTSSFRIAEIRPQVNGLILKRLFTEGAEVKPGKSSTRLTRRRSKRRWKTPEPHWDGPRRTCRRSGPGRKDSRNCWLIRRSASRITTMLTVP